MKRTSRPWALLGLTGLLWGLVSTGTATGCGTDPVNPDGCKEIELARCQAAPACSAFGADFDVDACERFYRDQCLKGLQTENDPGKPRIDACVRAIQNAGACARDGVTPCNVGTREIPDPCAIISTPENFTECGFLDDFFGEEDGGLNPFNESGAETTPEPDTGNTQDAATEAPLDEAG
jgi:hypothetical protein